MKDRVEQIIGKITKETEIGREEIIDQIEEKQEKFSGLITPAGAAAIIARGLGVEIDREEPKIEKLKIDDLSVGMSNIDVVGRISRIFEPREFERKDGSQGKVANLVLFDDTGEIRIVFWDDVTDLISRGAVEKGDVLHLKGAYIKKGRNESPELNIGRRGEVELDPDVERAKELPELPESRVKIADLDTESDYVDVVGRVASITAPREFERNNGTVGKVASLRIADETGQCRVSMWGDHAETADKIDRGDAIKLESATVRDGFQGKPELHMNWLSRVNLTPSMEEIENLPHLSKKLLKIEEIEPDMPVLDLAAKIRRIYSPNNFTRKNGSTGRVMNVVLADETGTVRASFWNEMVDFGRKLSMGDTILLENVRSKTGLRDRPEIQVGGRANLEVNPSGVDVGKIETGRIKMSELKEGLDSFETLGRIFDLSKVREFTRSDGSDGKVASISVADDTGVSRVVLWGEKTTLLKELEIGDIIKIEDVYSVSGNYGEPEIHLGEQSDLEVNPEVEVELPKLDEIEENPIEKGLVRITEAEENSIIKIRGTIVRLFERKPFFLICPKCGRTLENEDSQLLCEECGEIQKPEYNMVLNMILDDGTGNIRVAFFGGLAEKLLEKRAEKVAQSISEGTDLKDVYNEVDIEGREIIVSGRVRRDTYFDQLELRASDLESPDPEREAQKILERIEI